MAMADLDGVVASGATRVAGWVRVAVRVEKPNEMKSLPRKAKAAW
jgi:hypothetical protein